MLYLGLVIGLLIGAGAMYLKNSKDLEAVKEDLLTTQDKLKSVKTQLYKRRSTYRKKTNSQSNGKKTVKKTRKKTTNAAKAASKKAI